MSEFYTQKIEEEARRKAEKEAANRKAQEEKRRKAEERARREKEEETGLMVPKQTVYRKGKPWYSIARQEPTPMVVPEQTVRDKSGKILYTIKAGEQPGTYVQTVPGETVTETVQTGTMYSTAPITPPKPWVAPGPPAPESEQYLDAVGDVERRVGEQALETIEGTRPETYRGYARVQQEQAAESYERFFQTAIDKAYTISDIITKQAEEAKTEGKDVEAGIKYAEGLAVASGAGFLSGVTQIVRPYNIPRSISAAAEIAADPEKFQKIVPKTKTEWLKGYVSLPSILLGGKVTSEAANIIRYKLKEANIRELAKAWEPSEQLLFEEELGIAYPEVAQVQRTATRGLEEVKDIGVLPFKEGDPYLFGRKMTLANLEINEAILKKAYLQTGAGTELVLVPPKTQLMPVYKPIPGVEIAPTWKPGVRYTWIDPTIPFKKVDLSTLGITVTPVSLTTLSQRETQITRQIQRQSQESIVKLIEKINEKPIVTIIERPDIAITQDIIETTIQTPVITTIEDVRTTQEIIEEPVVTITEEEFFITTETTTRRRPRVKTATKKKRKKKKKKRKKGVFEVRVDFKEPKLPDIGDIKFKEPKIKGLKL